ncbi:MAG: hypothetical protein AB7S36_11265 [Planctomycetota bacterium]
MTGRKLTFVAVAMLAAYLASGCGTPFIELSDDQGYSDSALAGNSNDPYVRVWQAMRTVMEREFGANMVHVSTYPHRQNRVMYAHSRVHGEGGNLQRVEVQCYVARDKYNECVPQIVCWHQLQSETPPATATNPILFGAGAGGGRIWHNWGGRASKMEARLTNLVYEALEGANPWDGKGGTDIHSKPYIEWEG